MNISQQLWTNEARATIVAEIGNNHEGSFSLAEELIGKAAEAGADVVKFQTFIPELYITSADAARMERLKKFQLSFSQFESLATTAANEGLVFLSTPFDLESAGFLNSIQAVFKIASGDNNFWPLIDLVASFGKPIIASTGLISFEEVSVLHSRIRKIHAQFETTPWMALLHCVSAYPVPKEQANVAAVSTLANAFPESVIGYSDHTTGIKAAILARALGAKIIEKHFTIDKNYSDFRDHQLSSDPTELRELVTAIRETETYLGTGNKHTTASEKPNQSAMRRSIAAREDIPAGVELTTDHLTWVRPGNGLQPGTEKEILGKVAKRSYGQGEVFSHGDFI